jgi:hypothetical protein
MNLFQANLVVWGDRPGLGTYEVGHYLQHQQYAGILAGQAVFLPSYNILRIGTGPESDPGRFLGDNENEFLAWLSDHESLHLLLRERSNVSGIDLSALSTQSVEQWQLWQEAHAQEHALFDQFFGTT